MSVAAVLLPPRVAARSRSLRTPSGATSRSSRREADVAAAAFQAGYDEVVAVVVDREGAGLFPDDVTVLLEESGLGEAAALHAALDWCARAGHAAVVAGLLTPQDGPDLLVEVDAWKTLLDESRLPISVATRSGQRGSMLRLDASVWSLVPLEGALTSLLSTKAELVTEVEITRAASDVGSAPVAERSIEPSQEWAADDDVEAVEQLLGRKVAGRFSVIVRDARGTPVVIRNAPLLDDGTPMPTRYWLVGRRERELVGRLESAGGVDRAEAEVDAPSLAAAHARYAEERDAAIPAGYAGPVPSGGVGGTRVGVKCLHAHLAWHLAGGVDPVGWWTAMQLRDELEGSVAAIDCGTNSTRLLIVDRNGATLERKMIVTRLGAGVDERHLLDREAIDRTLAALRTYRSSMDSHGVVNVRATATSAARDASNANEFFDAAEEIIGVRPELLEGSEEGSLSYRGATSGLAFESGPFLVCDLGGGSTELVAGTPDGAIAAVVSLNIGCVRITERFLTSDPPSMAEIVAAQQFVRTEFAAAISRLPALLSPRTFVGVAGTVSTLTGLQLGLVEYEREALHHQRLTVAEVESLFEQLAEMTVGARRALPGIEPGRADVIVGGALVLVEAMRALGHEECIYSEDDILDGLVASMRAKGERA